jgi:hypothetical protein
MWQCYSSSAEQEAVGDMHAHCTLTAAATVLIWQPVRIWQR